MFQKWLDFYSHTSFLAMYLVNWEILYKFIEYMYMVLLQITLHSQKLSGILGERKGFTSQIT